MKKDGTLAARTYKLSTSKQLLRMLLEAQQSVRRAGPDPQITLIADDELFEIRRLWRTERQDWDDSVPLIYREVCGHDLQWPIDDDGRFDTRQRTLLESTCQEYRVPVDLITRLLEVERQSAGMARRAGVQKQITDVLAEEWRTHKELLDMAQAAQAQLGLNL